MNLASLTDVRNEEMGGKRFSIQQHFLAISLLPQFSEVSVDHLEIWLRSDSLNVRCEQQVDSYVYLFITKRL